MTIAYMATKGVQAHLDEIRIEFPETGIVRLKGGNNDGKSVIPKVFAALVKGRLRDPETRVALINFDRPYADFEIGKTNGDVLKVRISQEAKDTYLSLIVEGIEVRRSIAMGGWSDIIEAFGFHYNKESDVSLNIYETYDPLIMINTSYRGNHELVMSAVTDSRAKLAIDNLQLSIKEHNKAKKELEKDMENYQAQISNLSEHDIETEEVRREIGIDLLMDIRALSGIPSPPKMPDISILDDLVKLTPTVDFDGILDKLILPNESLIRDLEILFMFKKLHDVSESLKALEVTTLAMEKNLCPVCERNYNS